LFIVPTIYLYVVIPYGTILTRWIDQVAERPAVKRGQMVNRPYGDKSSQLLERHDASDFELRTQDILDPDPEEGGS
jgi:GST-like protein